MSNLLRPEDLQQIASNAELKKLEEERRYEKASQKQLAELRKAFMARDVAPEAIDRINQAVRVSAEQGLHRVQVLTFPSTFCSDRGRMINNAEPDWPSSLSGFALKAYQFFEKELRPNGFKLTAEIVTWPDGMPGDIAFYLNW